MSENRDRAEQEISTGPENAALTLSIQGEDTCGHQSLSSGASPLQMATSSRLPRTPEPEDRLPDGTPLIGMEEAMEALSRDERFMATIYALRTTLVQKGILSPTEIDYHFRQWAQKTLKKKNHL